MIHMRRDTEKKQKRLEKRKLREKIKRRNRKRVGLPPGTLIRQEGPARETSYELFRFNATTCSEESGKGLPDLQQLKDRDHVIWLNLTGVEDSEFLSRFGEQLNIHPIVLEDIQNTVQRPKFEEYGDLDFLVFRMLRGFTSSPARTRSDSIAEQGKDANGKSNSFLDSIESEQISLILGDNFVISFQERPGDVFDPVRSRIRNGRGRIRQQGADYLAYALLDLVVDSYFLILEKVEDRLEDLEDMLEEGETEAVPGKMRRLKEYLITVRRAVRPLREVVDMLIKEEPPRFKEETKPYLRDLGDHVHRVIDTVEMLKEMQSILGGAYQAAISNDMNSIMKVLTIIATIFIPLTFVAGIYGMNFEHMPELAVAWAYPAVLGCMAAVVIGMLLFFRKKGWL
ncbi:MAG: magnesium/cobalt transporter CorA [Spirochaetaceae bacterium]